ncbi:fumarylacetoacetate hydrolase family protein [Halobacillus naozhouensis]|uniref:Fumarylacetoacetate hydrolase family protein n=1 Tax=Halobacillus naozhouensis TaxID=554880 RepID=A0ABY8IYJ1_9BACI|nr:fumarylacetoacetate hydrolase family protein [Halobacillus naozhouensis]WFT75302.1 fumarylacetoacetate hydrolase family protein [Halobacillus naozhouensis]
MPYVRANHSGSLQHTVLEVNLQSSQVKLKEQNVDLEGQIWNPPVSGTVYGTLLNYKGSLEKMGESLNEDPYKRPPQAPVLYIKPANTLIGHQGIVPFPKEEDELEIGASLGIVIGQKATKVSQEDALNYVEGYTVVSDISIPHESVFRPAIKEKARDGFCPVGPWVIEKEAVENVDALDISVYINDEVKQENNTKNLVRSVSELLKDVTEFMTLNKGDVLMIGIPENAPKASNGDHVRIEIENVGTLKHTIAKK